MSTVDPFTPGSTLLAYRLVERVGTTAVWRAEDTRSGKAVAVKVLAKQLPRDPAKREALIREARLGGAIYHTSLVNIIEISPAGDALLMIMEWFDGQPSSSVFRGKPADRTAFFRVAYQLADALKFLQAKLFIHGNIAGDSVLVGADGHVRLAGFNVTNLMSKRESPSFYQQKGNDPRAVSYMAPEQIKGEPLTPQSDIFSLGIVLYEAATGRLPYVAPSAPEIARKIVDEQPASPKSINPAVDNAVLGVMGRCLFKDPFKRQKDARALVDDINKVDGDAAKFASDLAKAAITGVPVAKPAASRNAILFVADVANYDQLNATDPASAQHNAARMQQILGEAVYLFDGQIVDPFGARMVAELPSVDSALEAARKGEFDFSIEQQGSAFIPVRLLLHAGDVETRDGKVVGPAVDKAFDVLQHIEPLQLFVSEEFVKKGRGSVRLRDAGARAGVKLYSIAPTEPPKPHVETAVIEAQEREAADAEEAALAAAAAAKARKKKRLLFGGVAAALLVLVTGVVLYLMLRPRCCGSTPLPTTRASASPQVPTAAHPRKVALQPFTMETQDPALQQRAEGVRLASIEVLRGFPELRVVDAPGPDVRAYTATVRGDAAAPQLVPASGQPVALADAASGIQSIVQWVSSDLKVAHPVAGSPEAYNAFADAVASIGKDDAKAEVSLRASIKADPNLLPAQVVAMRFFAAKGKDADALAAARQVIALDPANLDAARLTARAGVKAGDIGGAINGYAAVLRSEGSDAEALNAIGRYAVAASDTAKTNAVVARLGRSPAAEVHAPDLLLAAGRLDDAVNEYYKAEDRSPNNAAIALKIGRLAVLRHSTPMAEEKLKKLVAMNAQYQAHLLSAYLAAASNKDPSAELKAAAALSQPGDDYWTCAAEVAAIAGNAEGTVAALERAAERKEPTASYVLTNRLFGFLASDPRYLKVREKFAGEQNEIRAALANVAL